VSSYKSISSGIVADTACLKAEIKKSCNNFTVAAFGMSIYFIYPLLPPMPLGAGRLDGIGLDDGAGLVDGAGRVDGAGLVAGAGLLDGAGLVDGDGIVDGLLDGVGLVEGVGRCMELKLSRC
jgi:hypothetical protein